MFAYATIARPRPHCLCGEEGAQLVSSSIKMAGRVLRPDGRYDGPRGDADLALAHLALLVLFAHLADALADLALHGDALKGMAVAQVVALLKGFRHLLTDLLTSASSRRFWNARIILSARTGTRTPREHVHHASPAAGWERTARPREKMAAVVSGARRWYP